MIMPASGRRGPSSPSVFTLVFCLFSPLVILGCDSREVREWTPGDHDQQPTGQSGQVAPRPASSGASASQEIVEIAWQRNCASCHGQRGRGDGPQGPMVQAPDLTRADWQSRVNDVAIAEVIRKGRNRMPPFAALSDQVVLGLVGRIRANRASP